MESVACETCTTTFLGPDGLEMSFVMEKLTIDQLLAW